MSTGRSCNASATGCAQHGLLAGIGIAACLEPSGGNSSFEPLLNPKNTTTTWMESCRINVDALGHVTATIHTTSSGQGHETLAATVIGEVLQIDPDRIRIVRPDSLASLPGNSPVGSRMAIMLGGAAFHAAEKLKRKLVAHRGASVWLRRGRPSIMRPARWPNAAVRAASIGIELVTIAHRNFHLLPHDIEPGLEVTHVMQVPTGTALPTPTAGCRCIPAIRSSFTSCWSRSIPNSASRNFAAT